MPVPRPSRRIGWLVLVLGLMLWPRASYADQQVYADFDGDGRSDHATFDPAHASVLRVWLSSNPRAGVLHSRLRILRLAAIDLDGDGHPELVAMDHRARLHVWKAGSGRFRSYRHRRASSSHVTQRKPGRTVEDDPASADDSAPSKPYGGVADLDANPPRIAWDVTVSAGVRPADHRAPSSQTSDSSAPRAPPTALA
jgi:hypothetical protein